MPPHFRPLSLARLFGPGLFLCSLPLFAQGRIAALPEAKAVPGSSIAALPEAPSASLGLPVTIARPLPDAPALLAEFHLHAPFLANPTLSAGDSGSLLAASDSYITEAAELGAAEPQQGAGEPRPAAPAPSRTGQQPKRILGLMPNYRSVSSGTVPPPPTIKQNFMVATKQAFDYSSFVFLGITSAAAYAQDSHPSLDTYNGGDAVFWAYIWRGFVDKTDGNYLAAFILPTILREDTRYYAMGEGPKWKRLGYAASRVVVARTYGGRTTPNLAGIGGKVAAQAISPNYYPPGSSDFGVLATKFAYAVARDMGFTIFREFYPDIAIHVLHRAP